MKKLTNKNIINKTFKKVFSCGYCDLQFITSKDPIAYNKGLYGWNYDLYDYNGIAITSGYRNTCGKRIAREFLQYLQQKAMENKKYMFSDSKKYNENKENIEKELVSYLENN